MSKFNIENWIVGNDTGISSKTLWMAMKSVPISKGIMVDVPFDADDFGRCYRLMQIATPEQKKKALRDVDIICPEWKPFARDWEILGKLYLQALDTGVYTEFSTKLDELLKEAGRR